MPSHEGIKRTSLVSGLICALICFIIMASWQGPKIVKYLELLNYNKAIISETEAAEEWITDTTIKSFSSGHFPDDPFLFKISCYSFVIKRIIPKLILVVLSTVGAFMIPLISVKYAMEGFNVNDGNGYK